MTQRLAWFMIQLKRGQEAKQMIARFMKTRNKMAAI